MLGADRGPAVTEAAGCDSRVAEAHPALFGFGAVQAAAAATPAVDVRHAFTGPESRASLTGRSSLGTPYTTTRCTAATTCATNP